MLCFNKKFYTHAYTPKYTQFFLKIGSLHKKEVVATGQAWSTGTTGGKGLVLLHHFSYVHHRQPGRIVKNRDPKSQTDWVRIPAPLLL